MRENFVTKLTKFSAQFFECQVRYHAEVSMFCDWLKLDLMLIPFRGFSIYLDHKTNV